MAKRGRPPTGKPWNEGRPVRLDKAIVSMAKAVATSRGQTIGEYVEPLIEATVKRDYAAMLKQLEKADGR